MTTENRVICVRGVVDDILAGGIEIPVHRTTSCGLAAVAQETGQTNIHFMQFNTGNGRCAILPYASRRSPNQEGSRELAIFFENLGERNRPRKTSPFFDMASVFEWSFLQQFRRPAHGPWTAAQFAKDVPRGAAYVHRESWSGARAAR
jgi:hypothetical protein